MMCIHNCISCNVTVLYIKYVTNRWAARKYCVCIHNSFQSCLGLVKLKELYSNKF